MVIPLDAALAFTVASTLLAFAPGPDNLFVLTQSALHGRLAGIQVTLGFCTGILIHTAAVALGVAALLQASPMAFNFLKSIGAGYLLWLAWQAFRASATHAPNAPAARIPGWALYRRGIIMNGTNPKVAMFFLAFLPQFTAPERGAVALQIAMLGGLFILVTMVVFGGVALVAGSLGAWLQRKPKAQVYLNWLAGLVFVLLAGHLLFGRA